MFHLPAIVPVHPLRRPLVEATHGDLQFTAPLTGITAAAGGGWRFREGRHLGPFGTPVEDWHLLANEAPAD